jgi:epoxyqueuosine reductase
LARNAPQRIDPQRVLPGARSIVTLALSYAQQEAPAPEREGRADPPRQPNGPGDLARATGPAVASDHQRRTMATEVARKAKPVSPEPASEVAARLPSSTDFPGWVASSPISAREDTRATRTRRFMSPDHGSSANDVHPEPPPSLLGVVARYARNADYHHVLAEPLEQLAAFINALDAPATRSLAYVDTGPVLERDLAQRAGLGFIGKHTNLISRQLGNWFLLAEILTTLELEPDSPEPNRCGTCNRCLAACPTRALIAPFQLDARLCISYLTIELKGPIPLELRPTLGNRIFGCDDCLAACPWNRFAQIGRRMCEHSRPDLADPDLLELLALDEIGFKRRFADTPLARTKRRGLLRNVCVALGNAGTPSALPALERATHDPEPLIAEHAHWAVEQIAARTRTPPSR